MLALVLLAGLLTSQSPAPTSADAGLEAVSSTTASGGARFTAVAPRRVMNTRTGLGVRKGTIPARGTVTLTVPGLPAGTTAVTLNVTASAPTRAGHVTAYPAGRPRPGTPSLHFRAGTTVANMITVAVGSGGRVSFYNHTGSTHLTADLAGHFSSTGAQFTSVAPRRVMNTRTGLGVRKGTIPARGTVTLTVPGLPAGTTAVTLNVTASAPTRAGHVTAYPAGRPRPGTPTLHFRASATVANMITVAVGSGGRVSFYNHTGSTHLTADLAGHFSSTSARFTSVAPRRVMNTRTGLGVRKGTIPARGTVTLTVPGLPAGTTAVTLNVTASAPTRAGHVTAYPAGRPRPGTPTLHFRASATVANMITVAVGSGGRVSFYNHTGSTHLTADLAGHFTGPVRARPVDRFAFYYQAIKSQEDIAKLGDVTAVVTTSNARLDPQVVQSFQDHRAQTGRHVKAYRYFQTYWYPAGRAIDGLDMATRKGWAFCLSGTTPALGKWAGGNAWYYLDFNEGAVRNYVLQKFKEFKALGYDGVFLDRGLASFTSNTIGRHPDVWHHRSTCTNSPYIRDTGRATFSDSFAALLPLAHQAGLELVLNSGYSPRDEMFPLRPDPRDPLCRQGKYSSCRTIQDITRAVDYYLDEAVTHPNDVRWARDYHANAANEQDATFGGKVIGLITDNQLNHDTSARAVHFAYARSKLFDFPVTAFTGDDRCEGVQDPDLCNRMGIYPRLNSANFGRPIMAAPQRFNCVSGSLERCVWVRTYTGGISVVNVTPSAQTVKLTLPGGCRVVTSLVTGKRYGEHELLTGCAKNPMTVQIPAWSGLPLLHRSR